MNRGWRRVVVAATGDSFTLEQAAHIEVARARGDWRVLAVSDAWERLPNADAMFASDGTWWHAKRDRIRHIDRIRSSRFGGELWTQHKPTAIAFGLKHVHCVLSGRGLPRQPDVIHAGKNSGFMAVCLAYLFGARQIIVVGIDMKKGPTGKQHYFGNHPDKLSNEIPFADCIARFRELAADLAEQGVDVANCSTDSALDCFRRANLEDVLSC